MFDRDVPSGGCPAENWRSEPFCWTTSLAQLLPSGEVPFAPCVDGLPLARDFLMYYGPGWCGHVFDLLVRHS